MANITSEFRTFAEVERPDRAIRAGDLVMGEDSQRHIRSIRGWESVQEDSPRTFVSGRGEDSRSRKSASSVLRGSEAGWSDGAVARWKISLRAHKRDKFYVYVAWGRAVDRPLYIGKANHLWRRLGQHMIAARWRRRARSIEVYAFDTEAAALAAETRAITELNPIYNIRRASPPAVVDGEITDEQMRIVQAVQARKRVGEEAA